MSAIFFIANKMLMFHNFSAFHHVKHYVKELRRARFYGENLRVKVSELILFDWEWGGL